MKLLLTFFMLCSVSVRAQIDLKFDKLLLDCEDKWVALPSEESGSYYYGFIYLDNSAGLTFNYQGIFHIDGNENYTFRKQKEKKIRLAPNKVLVAVIPDAKFKDLGIDGIPDWLAFYKQGEQNIDRLFRLAHTYNQWNDQTTALKYLNQVKKMFRKYPGLDAEYYYAYKGKKRDGLANSYLLEALTTASDERQINCETYKATVFKQTNANQLKQAEEVYYYAIKECVDEIAKADMAYNIAYQYYKLMNKEKLKQWTDEVNRWNVPNESYAEKTQKMQAALN